MIHKVTVQQILKARLEILYLWCDEGRDVMEMDEEALNEAVFRLVNKGSECTCCGLILSRNELADETGTCFLCQKGNCEKCNESYSE